MRARPDAAEAGADRLDFYCDGYLPLLQLRDCTARVAILNEILQSVSAPPDPGSNDDMGNDVAGLTGSPSFGPTAPPTATPRDVPAELDTVRVSPGRAGHTSSRDNRAPKPVIRRSHRAPRRASRGASPDGPGNRAARAGHVACPRWPR